MAQHDRTRPLDGHVALVTGAGRGIGAAIAWRLARDGAAVCVADLDMQPASSVVAEIEAAGGRALAAELDVRDRAAFDRAASAAHEQFGDLSILVNNAGVVRRALAHKVTDEDWDLHQNVMARGTLYGFQAVAPWFRVHEPARPRRVVNIASIAGIYGALGTPAYSAAKASVIGLTKAMAVEWSHFGVTVNAVAPGFVDTRMTGVETDVVRDKILGRIPLKRAGTPEDIAGAVAYFCSPDAVG